MDNIKIIIEGKGAEKTFEQIIKNLSAQNVKVTTVKNQDCQTAFLISPERAIEIKVKILS